MMGPKRDRLGRDFYDPSLSVFPLFKGVSEDLGRDRTKTASSPFLCEKLLSPDSKIGGTFITMPVKGVGNAFQECYKGLVTLVQGILTTLGRHRYKRTPDFAMSGWQFFIETEA